MQSNAEVGVLLTICLLAASVSAEISPEDSSRAVIEELRREAAARSEKHHQKTPAARGPSGEPREHDMQQQQPEHHRGKWEDKRAALADFKRAALADFKRAALADFKRAALADFKRAALADFKRAALADFKRAALADFKRAALADFKRSHTESSEREMSQNLRQHAGKSVSEKRAYYWDVCSRWVNGHEKLYVCRKQVR